MGCKTVDTHSGKFSVSDFSFIGKPGIKGLSSCSFNDENE